MEITQTWVIQKNGRYIKLYRCGDYFFVDEFHWVSGSYLGMRPLPGDEVAELINED